MKNTTITAPPPTKPEKTVPKTPKSKHYQHVRYSSCGCELAGTPPLPAECPTHSPKAVVTKKPEMVLAIVLDESGSMQSVKEQTISGLNEYLEGLNGDTNVDYLVTLTKFDERAGEPNCRVQYQMKPLSKCPKLDNENYQPYGSTPLYDAVGQTVREIEDEAGARSVMVVIATDGAENASREFNQEAIKKLIEEKQATGKWTFVFLGADQNAWLAAGAMGVPRGNTKSYSGQHTNATFAAMANATRMRGYYAASGQAHTKSLFSDARVSAGMSFDQADMDTLNSASYQVPTYMPPTAGTGTTAAIVNPVVTTTMTQPQMASLGGQARQAAMTPEEKKRLGKKAAKARWKK